MKTYNKKAPSSYLMNLDANKLYGWAMCKKLPYREFKWARNLSLYTEHATKNYKENSD